MKQQLTQILNRKIVSNDALISVVQMMCFGVSILVFALSFWKLSRLDMTETQLFFGILLSAITPLLFIILGFLMPMAKTGKNT